MRRARQVSITVLMLAVLLLPALAGSALADIAEAEIVTFEGVIQVRPVEGHVGTWTIADRVVEVVDGTIVDDDVEAAAAGTVVVVFAKQYEDSTLKALLIRKPQVVVSEGDIHLAGFMSEVGEGYFVINGIRMAFNEQTEFTGGTLVAGCFAAVIAKGTDAGHVAEMVHVAQVDDERLVQLEGILERLGDTVWVVDGQEIMVNLDTTILGAAQAGLHVEVTARAMDDGTLVADQINVRVTSDWEPEQISFSGEIESSPVLLLGKWTIGGETVFVAPRTELEGTPAVGKVAHVEAIQLPEDKLYARRIMVENADADETQFTGAIEHFSRGPSRLGIWIVGGKPVAVLTETTVQGTPQINAQATVTGYEGPRGVFIASSIQIDATTIPVVVREGALHVVGYITKAGDGYVVVNSLRIAYTDETHIDGTLEAGLLAAVRASVAGAEYTATHIKTFAKASEFPIVPVVTPAPPATPRPRETPQGELHMVGFISEVGEGYIVANTTRINYDETTDIQGELAVGRIAAVRARLMPDGSYLAIAITTAEPGGELPPPGEGTVHFRGIINEVGDGHVVVNSTRVAYNDSTHIEGELRVGYVAQVIAENTPDGYVATSILTAAVELPSGDLPADVEEIMGQVEEIMEIPAEVFKEIPTIVPPVTAVPPITIVPPVRIDPPVMPDDLRDLFPLRWR